MDFTLSVQEGPGFLQVAVSGIRAMETVLAATRDVLSVCAKNKVEKVLVDVRGLAGGMEIVDLYEVPAIGFAQLERWDVLRQAAIVDRAERQPSAKFFETVARNRGFNLRVFDDYDAAAEWLSQDSGSSSSQ